MTVPCVRVQPEAGEQTRQALADQGLLDDAYDITVADGWLYVPVADPDEVPEDYEVVTFDAPRRETQTLPRDILGFEPHVERLGDIAILDEDDHDRAVRIAEAVMASDLPVTTVVNRASKVQGDHRVREWDVLAGEDTETVHTEYGVDLLVDIRDVYFSPRLATERHRVVEQVAADEHVFDMFAGVGPFVVPMAKRGATCVGCDLNPAAIRYLRENARRNGVADRVTALEGDVREVAVGGGPDGTDYTGWADRVVMNLPHSADAFLDTAVRLAGAECVIHLYDIQSEEDPFGPGEHALQAAADDAYAVDIETRRIVRSYAPHEVNICLDARLTQT
ncbi:class I SAM-dependent methyltransferase family protein [Halosegnis sp.]|uniref:class I SAM-dependent methyltransferase n=1 Tax=Halosegnis sp. TaxID=2864959 RepID=UPI0035D43830